MDITLGELVTNLENNGEYTKAQLLKRLNTLHNSPDSFDTADILTLKEKDLLMYLETLTTQEKEISLKIIKQTKKLIALHDDYMQNKWDLAVVKHNIINKHKNR